MPFSLYLHFPFCKNLCSYCDFYKVSHDSFAESSFYRALAIETRLAADKLPLSQREISTIFVGGGTPSMTNLDNFAAWLALLRNLFIVPEKIEFSFESNPESIDLPTLLALKELGINRPVFGIQSFNTQLLGLLNRKHNPHQSQRAVYYAGALGLTNFGVDLIFGLPGQTSRMLSADIDQLVDLDPPHISFYQLTIEQGTPLAVQIESGKLRLPDSELMLAMYKGGHEQFVSAGYHRYEVSSFAKPGFECRHNLGYWTGSDYLGLGPSAHSFIDNQRFANKSNLDEYIASLTDNQLPRVVDQSGPEERITEAIMLGLRTSRGISRSHFSKRFGIPIEAHLDRKQLDLLVKSGHLLTEDGGLRLSDEGILLADEITRRLLK
jgi:oxygen-independent coproporphyrinogen-3 oxidase